MVLLLLPPTLQVAGTDGTGQKRAMDPEEEAKRKKRMERFGIVDEKAEATARAEAEVRQRPSAPSGVAVLPCAQI